MEKTKLKERFEHAHEAFFEEKILGPEYDLPSWESQTLLFEEKGALCSENPLYIFIGLRQLLLFLPGATILFIASFGLTARFLTIGGDGAVTVSFIQLILLLGGATMTLVGLGDWRNWKHFFIPLSIVSIGTILGAIGVTFFEWFGFPELPFYFLPLAFMIPVLVKNSIDNRETE